MSLAALVLSAGLGTRMNGSKPLLDIAGEPALARILATIDRAHLLPVVVVLGRDANLIASRVDLHGCAVVSNPQPERGLSSSLALGLAAVPPASTGVLVFHADMPFVTAATVLSVATLAGEGALLAAPSYLDLRGFPVFISRRFFESLQRELRGDVGARDFIERHRGELRLVEVNDPGCVRDIDRPEDLVACAKEIPWTTFA